MTKKDLFDGLNYIDEKIIEEAAPVKKKCNKKKSIKKIVVSMTTIAALLSITFLGSEVIRLGNRVKELEATSSYAAADTEKETENISSQTALNSEKEIKQIKYAGIKSAEVLGEYKLASDYEQLYDTVKNYEDDDEYIEYKEYKDVVNEISTDEIPMTKETTSHDSIEDFSSEENTIDFSKTNVMTEGIDESDIVKTDGKYIYMVETGQISITDISEGRPGKKAAFRPEFKAPSDVIKELYVADDNMLLVTEHAKKNTDETICYSYDITDPQKPELIGESCQDGSYNTSRKIGDIVYIFTDKRVELPKYARNKALQEENLDKWVPKINDEIINYDCIYIEDDTASGTIISSFNVKSPSEIIDAKYVMNRERMVYVSNNAMYFYSVQYSSRAVTSISRMTFSDGKMEAGESTSVNGYINDDFAINEHNNYLYVLSTSDDMGVDVNTLYVFDEDMKEVGIINEIAKDENVRAARFVGNYIYFITYKFTDPLFIADISEPTEPEIIGELEVSGFSEYLHMWDDTHILGIGYGDSACRTTKLTMFDVSDPAHPVVENEKTWENKSRCCEAMNNYKAVLADPQKNLIGFAEDKYHLFAYDSKSGFNLINDEPLEYENEDGYRGIYKDNDFYVAGNGQIEYFKLDK